MDYNMYFKALPKMFYPYTRNGKVTRTVVPDIFRRVQLDRFFTFKQSLLSYYIGDGEAPEMVAHKIYGNTTYHWIVLIANDIIDVSREWPLSNEQLSLYCDDKYGVNNSGSVHHYVLTDDNDIICDWDATRLAASEIQAVTHREYEEEINNNKRQIFLLDPKYLGEIVLQYKSLVK
jgi:hypothetical protein